MNENPYESPNESAPARSASIARNVGYFAYGTAVGLLASNVPVAFWSALNFMTPNRHIYIVVATLAGGVVGAIVAGMLVAAGRGTQIRTRYWLALMVATLMWLVLFPAQRFGNRHEKRGQVPSGRNYSVCGAFALQGLYSARYKKSQKKSQRHRPCRGRIGDLGQLNGGSYGSHK